MVTMAMWSKPWSKDKLTIVCGSDVSTCEKRRNQHGGRWRATRAIRTPISPTIESLREVHSDLLCREVYCAQIVTNSPTMTRSHPPGPKGDLTSPIILEITRTVPKPARIFPILSHNLHCFKTASPNATPQFVHKYGRPEISLRHSGHEIKSMAVISPKRNERLNIIIDRRQQRKFTNTDGRPTDRVHSVQ